MCSESKPKTAFLITGKPSLCVTTKTWNMSHIKNLLGRTKVSVLYHNLEQFTIWHLSSALVARWKEWPFISTFLHFHILSSWNFNISYTIRWLAFTTNVVLFCPTCKLISINSCHISFNPIHQHQLHTREHWCVINSVLISQIFSRTFPIAHTKRCW